MQRRAYLGVVGTTVVSLAGCTENEAAKPSSAGDAETTPADPGLRAEHRTQLEAHGWGEEKIQTFEDYLAEENFTQELIDQRAETVIEGLENTVASVERVESEYIATRSDEYMELRFKGVELANTRYQLANADDVEARLDTYVTPDDVTANEEIIMEVGISTIPWDKTETYRFEPVTTSKSTESVEFSVEYPELAFELAIVDVETEKNGYSPGLVSEIIVKVTNRSDVPSTAVVVAKNFYIEDGIDSKQLQEPLDPGESTTLGLQPTMMMAGDTAEISIIGRGHTYDTVTYET